MRRVQIIERKDCGERKVYLLLDGALVRLEDVRSLPGGERLALMESGKGTTAGNAGAWLR